MPASLHLLQFFTVVVLLLLLLRTVTAVDEMPVRQMQPLLFEAASKHSATVIFLHGLGDTGHGWASAVENWRMRSRLNHVKFMLPHAPMIPITCNGGMQTPGWYDIAALTGRVEDLRNNQDETGLLRSREYVSGLIQAEIDAGIPSNRIVLGGFSQGGAVSLFTGLTGGFKLAGIIGMSSYMPLDSKLAGYLEKSDLNRKTPVQMCHGSADPVVPTALGKETHDMLKKLGFDVDLTIYPGLGHSACLEEIEEVEGFIGKCLPADADKKSEL
ncbi:acyl-protein thioesterase-1-like protein [Microdochium trichocladiopsis]|uniref:Acyl-protein thioesterase 1 n=1 Tax=Microdochium trichocladiopsis TaxID=1682393 RepID=A0A9P9BU68_9PEZI|nr:acyl-protein thioesterase-1-like protein [Microdochium trichocladiopsis]KAH7037154.1 acyl-protein thioesterase-1-like protein [Microdochium trichocladiopsis]